jgi:tetratricopeptide (TPR) repeat protein
VTDPEWERRLADAYATVDSRPEAEHLALIDALAAELPADDPRAAYERGGAFDSTGDEARAIPLYRQALEEGLPDPYRRQCVIQLASSLRNVGEAGEAVALLTHELADHSDALDDAVRAFLALALSDVGMERAALSLALGALAPHLPRYQRSVTNYAAALTESAAGPEAEL